jgi:hypothetical protein
MDFILEIPSTFRTVPAKEITNWSNLILYNTLRQWNPWQKELHQAGPSSSEPATAVSPDPLKLGKNVAESNDETEYIHWSAVNLHKVAQMASVGHIFS